MLLQCLWLQVAEQLTTNGAVLIHMAANFLAPVIILTVKFFTFWSQTMFSFVELAQTDEARIGLEYKDYSKRSLKKSCDLVKFTSRRCKQGLDKREELGSEYPCGAKFLREFIFCGLAIFCVLRELIVSISTRENELDHPLLIRKDRFFLVTVNFCDFQKVPRTQQL